MCVYLSHFCTWSCEGALAILLDFVFILAFSVVFGLRFNVVSYLWFSAVLLIVVVCRSLFGWFLLVLSFQLTFYFYLYSLDSHYFLAILSKVFYVGVLVCINVTCRCLLIVLGYLMFIFTSVAYLLMGRVYFYACSILGCYYYSVLLILIYVFTMHEFGFFALLVGFPISLIFFMKFALMAGSCVFMFFLFLLPIVFATEIGTFAVFEELLLCLILVCLLCY